MALDSFFYYDFILILLLLLFLSFFSFSFFDLMMEDHVIDICNYVI